MKKINICYDDVNELAMELTDEILNVFEDKNNSEHIKIYIDEKVLEGDCETAVGAYATINNKEIFLEAELFSLDGSQRFYHKDNDLIENAETLGIKMGKYLKKISNNSYKK